MRNDRIHHLSLLNCKAPNAVVLRLEDAEGMIKTTLKQLGKRFNSFYMVSDLYLNIWSFLEHRATTSAGKPVSILRVTAEKKNRPSFLLGSLFSTCKSDCFMILAPTRHEYVIVFIKCFCPIHGTVFYFMS